MQMYFKNKYTCINYIYNKKYILDGSDIKGFAGSVNEKKLSMFLLYSYIFRIILLAPAHPIILIFKIREKLKNLSRCKSLRQVYLSERN